MAVYFSFNGGEIVSSPGGVIPTNPQFNFSFGDEVSDTIEVCKNDNLPFSTLTPEFVLKGSDSLYHELTSPAFGYWTITGPGVVFPIINYGIPMDTIPRYSFFNHYNMFRATQSGWVTVKFDLLMPWQNTDTIFTLTKSFYVLLNEGLDASINFTSSTDDLCPGDTTTISFSVDPLFPYTVYPTNSLGLSGPNSYDYAFPGNLTVNINYTNDSTGCTLNRSSAIQVVYKQAPSIIANPASARKCPEDSVLIIAQPGQSVNWIGPTGDTLGTNFTIEVIPPGNYYYNLVDNDGCTLLSNTIEVRNIQAVIYDSIITSNICANQSAIIHLASDTNLNYHWLYPLFGSDTLKYISQPGHYSVQVALCSNIDTLNFEVKRGLSSAELEILGTQILCAGDSIHLSANSDATTFLWQPSQDSIQSIYINQPGWVKVTVSDTLGCVLSDSLQFTMFPLPPTPSALIAPQSCPGVPIFVSATSNYPIAWIEEGDTTVSQISFSHEVLVDHNNQGISGYAINTSTGCRSDTISRTLDLLTLTHLPPLVDSIQYCVGDSILIIPENVTGIHQAIWNGPNSFTQTSYELSIQSIIAAQAGMYICNAVPDSGYCVLFTDTVILEPRYLPYESISYPDSICNEQSISIQAPSIPGFTYLWNGPNGSSNADNNWIIPQSTLSNSGYYSLTTHDGNCVRTDSIFIFVSPIPPQIPTISYDETTCLGDTLFLFNSDSLNTSNAQLTWLGSSDFVNNSPNSVYLTNFQAAINSGIGLQYSINQCRSAITYTNIEVMPLPVFAFDNTYTFCKDDPYMLMSPAYSNHYLWSTGDTTNYILITESGTYSLLLTDEYGCQYAQEVDVEEIICDLDNSPNTFSPNGDGVNDKLDFTVEGGVIYSATIFDRWGKLCKVITSDSPSWDGTNMEGQKVDNGTFYYILSVGMINSNLKSIKGMITVFD